MEPPEKLLPPLAAQVGAGGLAAVRDAVITATSWAEENAWVPRYQSSEASDRSA